MLLQLGGEGTASALITFLLPLLIVMEEDAVAVMENQGSRIVKLDIPPQTGKDPRPKAAVHVLFAHKH